MSFTIRHDEANASREFQVRARNTVSGATTEGTAVGIGRNTGVTNFSKSILVEVATGDIEELFVFEIGGTTDIIANVELEDYNFIANSVGPALTVGVAEASGSAFSSAFGDSFN